MRSARREADTTIRGVLANLETVQESRCELCSSGLGGGRRGVVSELSLDSRKCLSLRNL